MRILSFIILFSGLSCTSKYRSNVTALDLSNRNLSAIPDSIFSLTQLEYLQLGNSFTLYPPLSATGDSLNKITTIPRDIEKLRQLRVLGICFNDLGSLPKEMVKLKKLDTLDISFNDRLSIAAELETLKKMHWLKYLNVVATSADQKTIDELRKSLPKARIDAHLEDLSVKTPE